MPKDKNKSKGNIDPTKDQIANDPELEGWNKYNTELTSTEEKEYKKWAKEANINSWDRGAYDSQGYWKDFIASGKGDIADSDGHRPDTYKKPNHPTFSNESKYHGVDGNYGGVWTEDAGYQPSKQTLERYGEDYYTRPKTGQFTREPNRPEHLDLSRFKSGVNSPTPLVYEDGGEVENMKPYKLWENVTGTPWAEAKSQGLTDGSSEKNIELQQRLLAGEFGQKAVEGQEINNNVTIENAQSMNTSKLWENVTGTPWKTAKSKNLTDGSAEKNIDLRNLLLAGEYGEIDISNPPQKEEDVSINQADLDEFSEEEGANKIVEVDGRKMVANRRGEPVHLTRNDLQDTGLHIGSTLKRIAEQNKQIKSPYVDKDVVKLEPEWKSWTEVKEKNKDLNKMDQADLITSYKADKGEEGEYVIVDKKKGLMHIYSSHSSEPVTSPIDLGKTIGDAQTVTKFKDLNSNNITDADEVNRRNIDWGRGNRSTGAGRFFISNVDAKGYGNLPLFNMMNERQYSDYKKTGDVANVATSFHKGYVADDNSRVSNGCVRCSKATLDQLYKTIKPGTEVFILPEDEGNAFVVENGKLNFKVDSGKDYEHYRPESKKPIPFIADEEKGQGVNRTINTLNSIPIKIEDNWSKQDFKDFAWNNSTVFNGAITGRYEEFKLNRILLSKAITSNKKSLMQDLKLNGDVYNELAQISVGIPNAETKYGTHQNYALKSNFQGGVSTLKSYKGNNSANSIGMNQVKYDALIQNPRVKELFKKYGVTKEKLNHNYKMDAYYSTLATMIVLGDMYSNELKGKDILAESGVEWQDALLYLYQGKRSELKNKTATPKKNLYIKNVKEGAKGFDIYQLD